MTKPNSSLVAVVIDRSGSMMNVRQETIDGFNSFINDQKNNPAECKMYYTQFDHEYEIVHKYIDIHDMRPLTNETYVPRGNTALRDAIGRTIVQVGADLAALSENQRPENVIFVIQTDGYENASREYTSWDPIKKMIAEQRDIWKWQFIFLGAGEGAMMNAQAMGIATGQTLGYSGQHTNSAFRAASRVTHTARAGGQSASFSDKERLESK